MAEEKVDCRCDVCGTKVSTPGPWQGREIAWFVLDLPEAPGVVCYSCAMPILRGAALNVMLTENRNN